MKFDKFDWFLLFLVIVVSVIFYTFYQDKMATKYLLIIILLFGLFTGTIKRILMKDKG